MRRFSRLTALAVIFLGSAHTMAFEFYQPLKPPRRCQIVSPGGQRHQTPENTAPAIEHAIRDLLEWIQLDVRRTGDGEHVILRDSELNRVSEGAGLVQSQTLQQLRALDAGSKFAERFAKTRILTLAEALALAKDRINLSLLCHDVDPTALVEQIRAAAMQRQVAVGGDPSLRKQFDQLAHGEIALLSNWQSAPATGNLPDSSRLAIVRVAAADLTADLCAKLHAQGLQIQVQLLPDHDRPEVWQRALDFHADRVETDLPEEFIAFEFADRKIPRPVQMALHRGASRYAPENTLPALEKALRLNADWVEIDVRNSAEGRLFVLHDATVDRRTNGVGPIAQKSAHELEQLDAGSWFARDFAGVRLIELDAALKCLSGRSGCYFDAKAITPQQLVDAIDRHDGWQSTVVFQGPGFLAQVSRLNSKVLIMPPLLRAEDVDRLTTKWKPYAVDAKWDALSPDLIVRCHSAGIKVFSDAIGSTDHFEQHLEKIGWGIDCIQTDHPLHVIRAMELHSAR